MIQLYDLTNKCSDSITNEVIKNTNSNAIKQIIFISINLGIDALGILVYIILLFILYAVNKIKMYFRFWKYNWPKCCNNCCYRWLFILIYESKKESSSRNNNNKFPYQKRHLKK